MLIETTYADLTILKRPPRKLSEKIDATLKVYPCNILFIHRDAEKESYSFREEEICKAWETINNQKLETLKVSVIPVRMSEAWLLFNGDAIRSASGNPNSKVRLDLPRINSLENEPNPKKLLHSLLKEASGLTGRSLTKLNVHKLVHLVADYTEDFSPLRQLPAFQRLEEDIKTTLANYQSL